jgi:hypothetical protein
MNQPLRAQALTIGRISLREAQYVQFLALRCELWDAINRIEDKAPDALIAAELTILDRVAETLGILAGIPENRPRSRKTVAASGKV